MLQSLILCHHNEQSSQIQRYTAKLILQLFRHFTYVTTHSPTLPSLYLHHSAFSNPSVASPTSQLILQPFFRFSYDTSSSLNTPGEPPIERTIMAGENTWYLQDPYVYLLRHCRAANIGGAELHTQDPISAVSSKTFKSLPGLV